MATMFNKMFKRSRKADESVEAGRAHETERWFVEEELRAGYVLVTNHDKTQTIEAKIGKRVKENTEVKLTKSIGNHYVAKPLQTGRKVNVGPRQTEIPFKAKAIA